MKKLSPLYITSVYFLLSLFWLVTSDYITFQNAPEWAYLLEPSSDFLYITFSTSLLYWLIYRSNHKVRLNDANYRHLFEQNPQPMWVYDPTTLRFLAVNKAAIETYGYSRQDFLSITKRDLHAPEDIPAFLEELEDVQNGVREMRLWRHRKKDNSIIYVENTSRSLLYKGKKAVLVLAQDVTERIIAGNRLRYHEELLQNVFDRIPVGICLTNQQGVFEEMNGAFCRIFEASPDQLKGSHFGNFLQTEDLSRFSDLFEQRFKGFSKPDSAWLELEIKLSSGEIRWVLAKGVMIRDVHNNPRMAIFVNDITESKKASQEREAVLHELQNYKTILDKSALVSVTDLKGNIIHANDLFCRITQFSIEELLGQNHRIINAGYHSAAFFREMWRTISSGRLWRGEIRNKAKDGSYFWVDTTINPVFDPKGKLIQYLSIRYDITNRKNSEARIKSSEAALLEAQRMARMGNWEYYLDNHSIYWSDEVYTIHGWDREMGPPTFDQLKSLYHPEDLPVFQQLVHEALTKGIPYNQDLRIVMPDEEIRNVNIIGKPEYNDQGKIVKLHGTITDVNERKLVEQHLQLQNEELKKINEELDRFVYSAGHDLRAPLMSVLGLINIAQMEENGGKKNEYMELMRRSIDKLDNFIKDIIHFSRNARTAITPTRIEFQPLLADLIENLQYMKREKSIETHIHVQQEVPFCSDPKRIGVILNNLIANAFRYSDPYKEQSFVHVQVHVSESDAHIIIQDNGIGIESEHIDKIFKMFYRATESRSGSGLGLYIVKETVNTLKGDIKVQSKFGEGTSFCITLPNLEDECQQNGPESLAETSPK